MVAMGYPLGGGKDYSISEKGTRSAHRKAANSLGITLSSLEGPWLSTSQTKIPKSTFCQISLKVSFASRPKIHLRDSGSVTSITKFHQSKDKHSKRNKELIKLAERKRLINAYVKFFLRSNQKQSIWRKLIKYSYGKKS